MTLKTYCLVSNDICCCNYVKVIMSYPSVANISNLMKLFSVTLQDLQNVHDGAYFQYQLVCPAESKFCLFKGDLANEAAAAHEACRTT